MSIKTNFCSNFRFEIQWYRTTFWLFKLLNQSIQFLHFITHVTLVVRHSILVMVKYFIWANRMAFWSCDRYQFHHHDLVNHDLLITTYVFPWRQPHKDWLLKSYLKYLNMYNSGKIRNLLTWKLFFIHTLDEKTIQNDFIKRNKNVYRYVLLKFEKQCWICTFIHKIISNISMTILFCKC